MNQLCTIVLLYYIFLYAMSFHVVFASSHSFISKPERSTGQKAYCLHNIFIFVDNFEIVFIMDQTPNFKRLSSVISETASVFSTQGHCQGYSAPSLIILQRWQTALWSSWQIWPYFWGGVWSVRPPMSCKWPSKCLRNAHRGWFWSDFHMKINSFARLQLLWKNYGVEGHLSLLYRANFEFPHVLRGWFLGRVITCFERNVTCIQKHVIDHALNCFSGLAYIFVWWKCIAYFRRPFHVFPPQM